MYKLVNRPFSFYYKFSSISQCIYHEKKNPPHLMILSDLLFEHFCAFQNKSFPEQGSAK